MREVVAGDRVDQYELTELLARSGMASIFKAQDTESGAVVALKIPHLQFESDVVFFERFRREEEIGLRLAHPNIVRVLKPAKKSRMYMVMEYAEGTSLRALLHAKEGAPRRQGARHRAAAPRGAGLPARPGCRSSRPETRKYLVGEGGRIKLLDFGIALDESARRLTWTGLSSTMGTPDYMAPEQVNGRRGDVRTDVYAVGVILYEMLTAELPITA